METLYIDKNIDIFVKGGTECKVIKRDPVCLRILVELPTLERVWLSEEELKTSRCNRCFHKGICRYIYTRPNCSDYVFDTED